jgi:hypothetical protein
LYKGKCYITLSNPSFDSNCKFGVCEICVKCYDGYYALNGKCVLVNPFCKTYTDEGYCTSCFGGYELKKNNCVRI